MRNLAIRWQFPQVVLWERDTEAVSLRLSSRPDGFYPSSNLNNLFFVRRAQIEFENLTRRFPMRLFILRRVQAGLVGPFRLLPEAVQEQSPSIRRRQPLRRAIRRAIALLRLRRALAHDFYLKIGLAFIFEGVARSLVALAFWRANWRVFLRLLAFELVEIGGAFAGGLSGAGGFVDHGCGVEGLLGELWLLLVEGGGLALVVLG